MSTETQIPETVPQEMPADAAEMMKDLTGDASKSGATRLSLKRKREELEIEDERGNVIECYLLEMLGPERDKYFDAMGDRVRYDKKGRAKGMKTYERMSANLIARCLFQKNGTRFTEQRVQSFPSSVQSYLLKRCRDMNGLDEDAEDDAKND